MKKTEEIIRLRSQGYSIPEISSRLSVPKTTVYYHARNITLSKNARDRLNARKNGSRILSERQKKIAEEKSKIICKKITDNHLGIIASIIYWCEGAKKDLSLMNSDPSMIKLFLFILRSFYGIKDQDIKISIRIYEDLNRQECLDFWSKTTSMQLSPATSVDVLQGKKTGKLSYGMCRVRVKKGGALRKQLEEIKKRIVEYVPS